MAISYHIITHLPVGSGCEAAERGQKGPYLGAVLGPVPPHMAVQVMLKKNIRAALEVPAEWKAPGMAWVMQMPGAVGTGVEIQSVVFAVMVIEVTAQVLSWGVSAQLGVTQVASQLENMMVMRLLAMQVMKQVTPQANHLWIRVPAGVGTEVDCGHPFHPFWEPTVYEVVWILLDWPALFGGSVDSVQDTRCQGRVLSGSTLLPEGKSLSWKEN